MLCNSPFLFEIHILNFMRYDDIIDAICYGCNTPRKISDFLKLKDEKLIYYYLKKYNLENSVNIRSYTRTNIFEQHTNV